MEAADGRLWVLKFVGAGPGPFGLLTEYLALGVARAFGAPVPGTRPLLLPDGFPWMAGTDEFDAMLQRSYGWNLGVTYVEGARPATPADLGPSPEAKSIARADVFLQNMDRRADNPNLLVVDGRLMAIDYDACLYLSRALAGVRPPDTALPAGHVLAGLADPARGAPAPPGIDFDALLADAPDDWVAAAGTTRAGVAGALAARYADWVRATVGTA